MRFSAIFQLPQPARLLPLEQPAAVRVEEPVAPMLPQSQVPASPEPPDDLDQRVRLVGEW